MKNIEKELSLLPLKIHCSMLAEDAIKAALKARLYDPSLYSSIFIIDISFKVKRR